jgi:hypothetical protein
LLITFAWLGRVAEMKLLDKTEQSDQAPKPNEKAESCYCSGVRPVPTLLYAMAGPAVRPVIREKSQFCAQVSAHDGTSLYLDFRALGRPFLWAVYFSPIVHARENECGSFAPILFRLALHGRCVRVLHLEPVGRAARAVRRPFQLLGASDANGSIRIAGIHKIRTRGAQQSFDLLDRLPNHAARFAGLNLAF